MASSLPRPSTDAPPSTRVLSFAPGGPLRRLEHSLGPTERTLIQLASPVGEPVVLPGTDPDELERLAGQLRLIGRLVSRAERLSAAGVPVAWVRRWSEALRSQVVSHLLLAQEEARLLEALQSDGVEAIPLKGVSLARILDGDPAARSVTDIDLGVRCADLARAAVVLERRGYITLLPRGLLCHAAFLRSANEHTAEAVYARDRAGHQLMVELHWKVLPLPEDLIWSSLEDYAVAGPRVRTLSPTLYFLYLCAHSSGHGWISLHWLCDVADFLLGFAEKIDAAKFLRHCSAARLRRRVGVTLELVEAYFGIRWEPADRLRNAQTYSTASEFLLRPLMPALSLSLVAIHRERVRLLDNGWERLLYLWQLAHPTHIEFESGQGYLRSLPMAWLVRMGRLTRLAWASLTPRRRPVHPTSAS